MTRDARLEIVLDHLDEAARLWAEGVAIADELAARNPGERIEKMFSKFLQDGYAELETALRKILALAGEREPAGPEFHRDLILMLARGSERRPPFAAGLLEDIDELRRFRHVSLHAYRRFDWNRAAPAIAAARRLASLLREEARRFLAEWQDLDASPRLPKP